jgi:hypothetical protein
MKTYLGTKIVKAKPMNRQEYIDYREWKLPDNEDGTDEGMLVEYTDGGKPNHPDHEGYISWSPLDVFSNAYRKIGGGLTFGDALELLKSGKKVARNGWNGKGMWLKLVSTELAESVAFQYEALNALPWIGMKTADNKFVPWLASQTDVLAEDWVVI